MRDASMLAPDGRALAFTECGAPDGSPVVYCHGGPGGRLDVVSFDAAFDALGIRVVAADRPGYGGSSPAPGRTMSDWPLDVAALADHLGIERFSVMGLSSGGPYVAACAALLRDRVRAAGIIAGVTDMGWPEAWEGYDEDEATLMRIGDETAAAAWCEERYGADGARFFEGEGELSPPDAAFLADEEMMAGLFPTFVEAFRQGVAGFAQDITVQGRSWPFDTTTITAPTRVYHGEQDTMVPISHGRHTAAIIPGATLVTFPEHGHVSMISEVPRVAGDLLAV